MATREITDRLDFLASLEKLVFDPELKQRTLERKQLHRIIANETWIFGEEYALTADDPSLRTALKEHIAELGRDYLAPPEVCPRKGVTDLARHAGLGLAGRTSSDRQHGAHADWD
jgi:hypothetical protein